MHIPLLDSLITKIINWMMLDKPPKKFVLADFKRIQYELRPGDVILIDGRSRVSEVIKQITQSHWSHAALYIGRIHEIETPLKRQRVQEHFNCEPDTQLLVESVLGKGTIITPLSFYEHDHIRICRPRNLSHHDAQQVINYATSKLGLQYDIRQLFDLARFLLPWSIIPNRWQSSLFAKNPGGATKQICSASIAEAFLSIQFPLMPLIYNDPEEGMQFVPRNFRLFTPSDFDYSPYFDIIKYPLHDITSKVGYQNFPWAKDIPYHNDESESPEKL